MTGEPATFGPTGDDHGFSPVRPETRNGSRRVGLTRKPLGEFPREHQVIDQAE